MIRHHVYFDVLGSLPEDSASWRSVFAGLSVLRLVDSYVDGDPAANPGNWAQLHTVRTTIESVSEGDPIRTVLMHLLEEISTRRVLDDTVSSALLAYGRALDYEASWGLATDVFATVAKVVKPEKNPRLVVEANIAVGGAARRNGDWETSARGYSQAAYIADTLGDRPGVLTVQVGIANTYMAKGNLPQAQTILDDVVMQARDQQLPEVESFALHSRAAIAQIRGDHAEGVKLAYDAFNLSVKPAERDVILADIAAGLSELGMRDAARDAHLILAATSQGKHTRWQATINLLELASLDGMEPSFDSYASELRNAPMGVWLRSHFLLIFGEGLARFGRFEAAEEILNEAQRFASANQIHRVAFQAESALISVASRAHLAQKQAAGALFARPTDDILNVIHGLTQLKAAAAAR